MELEGTVQNGVIVVDSCDALPEGIKVKILIPPQSKPSALQERLLKLAGTVDDLTGRYGSQP